MSTTTIATGAGPRPLHLVRIVPNRGIRLEAVWLGGGPGRTGTVGAYIRANAGRGAVAGLNGDFFLLGRNVPSGNLLIHKGRSFLGGTNRGAAVFGADGSVDIVPGNVKDGILIQEGVRIPALGLGGTNLRIEAAGRNMTMSGSHDEVRGREVAMTWELDLDYLTIGRGEGAELVYGGARLERETEGYFLEPALFVGTSNDMRVNREEIFGPIATVIRATDADEALALANDTEFGLSAGVCTTSLEHAARFRDGLQAGIVTVNLPTAGVDFHVPFGGTKGSSSGSREQGRYAVEFFTTVKTAYVKP